MLLLNRYMCLYGRENNTTLEKRRLSCRGREREKERQRDREIERDRQTEINRGCVIRYLFFSFFIPIFN